MLCYTHRFLPDPIVTRQDSSSNRCILTAKHKARRTSRGEGGGECEEEEEEEKEEEVEEEEEEEEKEETSIVKNCALNLFQWKYSKIFCNMQNKP